MTYATACYTWSITTLQCLFLSLLRWQSASHDVLSWIMVRTGKNLLQIKGSSSQKLCDKNVLKHKETTMPLCRSNSRQHRCCSLCTDSLAFICSVSSQPKNEGNIEVTFIFKLQRFKQNSAQPGPTRLSLHLPCIDILLEYRTEFAEGQPLKYFLDIYSNKFFRLLFQTQITKQPTSK